MKEINFYRAESGKSPVEEFLDNLAVKQAKKFANALGKSLRLEVV